MMTYDAIKEDLFIGLEEDVSRGKSIFRRPRCLHAFMGGTRLLQACLTFLGTQPLIRTERTIFIFLNAIQDNVKRVTTISAIKPELLVRSFAYITRHLVILERPVYGHRVRGKGPFMTSIAGRACA